MKKSVSISEAQEVLDSLIGKEIFFSCGYGGVMFVEIGNVTDHHIEYEEGEIITRKYGETQLFCDENWSFSDGKGTKFDRWSSSWAENDNFFASLGVKTIEKVEIINGFEKTIFHISDGCAFTIIRDDAIDTFSLRLGPEKKQLRIFGNGNIDIVDDEVEDRHIFNSKPRPKRTEKIEVERSFLRRQLEDEYPISVEKVTEFTNLLLNHKIHSIQIMSGTKFSLDLGEDCKTLLSKQEQEKWNGPIYRWSLWVDEEWVLRHGDNIVLDVREERFHFEEKLVTHLKDKHILEFVFGKSGSNNTITFSDNYSLTVLESGRYSRWSILDRSIGLSLGSYRDHGLHYRVHSPFHIVNEYNTGDVHLDAILSELNFYRNYFAGKLIS